MLLRTPFFDLFRGCDFLWYCCCFWGHFWPPFGTLWAHFGTLLAHIGTLLAPFWLILGPFWSHLGPDLGYFAPSGVSFWLVLGEIQFLRQKFVKKHSCIDPGIKFLANFRMQTIFPRPGGGTIAAGNRDSPPGRFRPSGACWRWKCSAGNLPACTLSPQ